MKQYPIEECPHCGCTIFLTKERAKGTIIYRQSLLGDDVDNHSMYESVESVKGTGIVAYCNDCERKLFKIKE